MLLSLNDHLYKSYLFNGWYSILIYRLFLPSNGWYSRVDADGVIEQKKWRAKDTDSAEFWDVLLKNDKFKEAIKQRFQVSTGAIMSDDEIDTAMETGND